MKVPRIAGWLLVGLVVAACGAAMALHFAIVLNADIQLDLDLARRWLHGRPLYTALLIPSPPMLFALYAPIAAANFAAGVPWALGIDLWSTCLLAMSLLLCRHILVCLPAQPDRLTLALILTLIAAGLVILPLRDSVFGDRDHLFAMLASPYLLRLSPYGATAALGRKSRVWIGVCAAIGLGIKPHLLAIWGMQQLYWMLRERSAWRVLQRLETQIVAALLGAYAAAIWWFSPAYLHTVAPMAWMAYPAISPPFAHRQATIVRAWATILALPLACCAFLLARGSRPLHCNLAYLLCLCVGASVSGFAGGWYYAYYPLYLFAFAFVACVIGGLLASAHASWPTSRGRAAGLLLPALFLLAVPMATHLLEPARERGQIDLDHQRRTGWPRGQQRTPDSVGRFLTRHLSAFTPTRFLSLGVGMWDSWLADFDPARISVSRFYSLWPLPALVAAQKDPERAARTRWIHRYLLDAATQDLREGRPDVVLIERTHRMWGLPRSFDVLGFFLRDPSFAHAWRDYAFVERIDVCTQWPNSCAFDVYYRNPSAP